MKKNILVWMLLLTIVACEDNMSIEEKNYALLGASKKGHLEIVKYLIDNGANINTKSDDGGTILMVSVFSGYSEIVKYLVENGTDINTIDSFDKTALW